MIVSPLKYKGLGKPIWTIIFPSLALKCCEEGLLILCQLVDLAKPQDASGINPGRHWWLFDGSDSGLNWVPTLIEHNWLWPLWFSCVFKFPRPILHQYKFGAMKYTLYPHADQTRSVFILWVVHSLWVDLCLHCETEESPVDYLGEGKPCASEEADIFLP